MRDLGNLSKKLSAHSVVEEKKIEGDQSMVEKISCLLEITIPPAKK